MTAKIKPTDLLRTITADVASHPDDLAGHLAAKHGVSRSTAAGYIRRLEADGWLRRTGSKTRPRFELGARRRVSGLFRLDGLREDEVWSLKFAQFLDLKPNVRGIAMHGFTEMLNNAIDHSSGNNVFVWAQQDEATLTLVVSDDGVGIFDKITRAMGLADPRQSLLELAKGKFTTDPSNHSGEGIFFTSRMFDSFEIQANGLKFNHDSDGSPDILIEDEGTFDNGTTVFMTMALDSARTTNDVYEQFTNQPEDFDFSKTVVPMRMAQYGQDLLVSRSQAKRIIARFDRFRTVVLDFAQIEEIGQAFADEIFRVYASAKPGVDLVPVNMTHQVERMYLRAIAPRA
ncbi:MAG: hypothetical protein RL268_79 [Pseudomonadota bacterium]|jgi:DNA-binding Lrp family transcriptional regulator